MKTKDISDEKQNLKNNMNVSDGWDYPFLRVAYEDQGFTRPRRSSHRFHRVWKTIPRWNANVMGGQPQAFWN